MDTEKYQSLKDPHLNEYFNNKRIRRHLIKSGLINRHGEILPAASHEDVVDRRAKRRQTRAKLSHTITNYVIEEERKRQMFYRDQFDLALKRLRVQKIRGSHNPPRRSMSHGFLYHAKQSKPRNSRTPSPKSEKRLPIRAKSTHHSPVINVKNQAIRRPATAKQPLHTNNCQVTMIYYGPPNNIERKNTWQQPNGDEIVVMQQHCGGENLTVFKGFVKPNETFTFDSRRHVDYPFALAIYINGLIDSRISVCCEYKHKHNVRLGSKYGLFGIYDVKKSQPCRACRFEQRKKKILSTISLERKPSPYRRPILTSEFQPGALLRTPATSPEREKKPAKRQINRVSTVAQASMSPRTVSSASSHHKDEEKPSTVEQKKDDGKKSSRVSSSTSKKSHQSSSDTYIKNEEPHHSSEPILSRKSSQSTIPFSEDEEDSIKLEKKSINGYPIQPLSSSSSTASIDSNKNKNNHVPPKSPSSSRSSLSIASVKNNDKHVPAKSPSLSRSSTPLAPIKNNDKHIPSSSSSSSRASTPLVPTKNNDSNVPSKSPSLSRSSTPTTPIKTNNKHIPSSLSSSRASTPIAPIKNNVPSKSSSSTTLKQSDSSSSNSFSEKDDDNVKEQLSRTSSRSSKTSSSSNSKNKPHEIISPTTSSASNKKYEPHRPSISSIDSDEIIPGNPVKPDSSSDTDHAPSKSIKPERRNDEDTSTKIPEKTPGRQYRAVENIILVWLDATIDDTNNHTKTQLRQVARTIRTYTDPNKCLQLFKEIKTEKIFLIVSGSLSETILEQTNDYSQVAVVYIFCQQKSKYEYLLEKHSKLKGIYTNIIPICEQLKIDSKQWDNDLNTFQISSIISDQSELNSQQLLFIQNQLFKQYLLDMKYDQNSKNDLIEYCQKLYIENEEELKIIQEFQDNYQPNNAVEWYIKDCFIYHILNRAIRTKDIKILFQMGFFIQDLHKKIEEDHSSTVHRSTLTVYRGQGIKKEYFEELKESSGGLLSFNGFVSTSKKQSVAYEFAQRSLTNGFPIAVLFRIKIDPKTTSTPFIDTGSSEFEILLSFKSIFSIEKIDEIENNLWQIDLILTDKISPSIEIENEKYDDLIEYEKLGELLINMNELNQAKDLYEINIPSNSSPKYTYIYKQLGLIHTKLELYNRAILYYKLSLKTKSDEVLNDFVMIANIHNEIGKLYYKQDKISEATEKFQEALQIQLEHLPSDDLSLSNTYNLLAMVYEEDDDYEKALENYQNQLDIEEESISTKQSDLALIHYKMATCLKNLNRFDEAMEHIQQSIDMSSSDDLELNERQTVLERIREQIE